jgi:outer membrane protein assembly factor BamD (BamD/ComL family)
LNNKQAAIDTFNEVINKFPASDFAEKAKDRIQDLSEE